MPLWLDLLRTPMAAPETPGLRRMRFVWQALCIGSALAVGLFAPLHHAFGRGAPIAAALLLLATLVQSCRYLVRKHRADTDFLEASGRTE